MFNLIHNSNSSKLGYSRKSLKNLPRTFNELTGQATVDQLIQAGKMGRVRFQGSWWYAQCQQDTTLVPGQVVRVVGRDNITLLVEPVLNSEYHPLPMTQLAVA